MPDQFGPGHGNASRSNELGHAAIKLRGLKLNSEEICVVGKKRRVKIRLDCSQVNPVIFSAGVVAHYCKAEQSEEKHGQQAGWKVVSLQTIAPRILSYKLRCFCLGKTILHASRRRNNAGGSDGR